MKTLERILLINWHNYTYELIPVKMITFLTGKTAAGKSTIIDALQLVLLADTAGTSFNKAANQKSARTLKGYLFGEQGDDGDTGMRFRREGGNFSSYVVLEFLDDESGKYYTAGYAADCYADGSISSRWFILYTDGIPECGFIEEGHPMNLDQLKAFFRRDYSDTRATFFDTNKSYLSAFLSKCGALDEKYTSLLRKAVPFTPISDITKFITESICDIESGIDIETMSSDIRAYKTLENEADLMEVKITELEEISKQYGEICSLRERLKEAEYIRSRAELEETEAELATLAKEEEKKESELSSVDAEIEKGKSEKALIEKELAEKNAQLYSSGTYNKMKELEAERDAIEGDIRSREQRAGDEARRIAQSANHWMEAHRAGLEIDNRDLSLLLQASTVSAAGLSSISIPAYTALTGGLYDRFINLKFSLGSRRSELENEIEECLARISRLESGIKPFPAETRRFMEEFEKETKETPLVFADLLELTDESWRKAAESYLGDDRFTLMISKKNIGIAYEMLPDYDDVRIHDLSREKVIGVEDSLYEYLYIEEEEADKLAELLLGDVKAVDEPDFSDPDSWVSRDGTFHKRGEHVRKIAADPFIGHEAAVLMLSSEKEKLKELEALLERLSEKLERVDKAADKEDDLSAFRETLSDVFRKYQEIPELKRKLKAIIEQLSSLDIDDIEKLRSAIEQLEEERKQKELQLSSLERQWGVVSADLSLLRELTIPGCQCKRDSIREGIEGTYDPEWISTVGDPKYKAAASKERAHSLLDSYQLQAQILKGKIQGGFTRLASMRTKYNASHLTSYDPEKEENDDYDGELVRLKDNQLPLYRDKITAAKESAYNQFRDDFISRIKSNIELIQSNIKTLNKALDGFTFGTDKYKFEVSPRKDYIRFYNMFTDEMLMDSRDNLWASSFEEKYKDEIQELFSILIYDKDKSSADELRNHEKKIALYTDYRTYLVFDLLVIDTDGGVQRLSRTLQKKSGGETQLPFYIALLASFSQVCKIRSKVSNNTLRLIILDEAFSKMDGERIRESIRLLREFKLQAIFSAPPEKTSDISTLVDETVMVYKDRGHSFTEEYVKK